MTGRVSVGITRDVTGGMSGAHFKVENRAVVFFFQAEDGIRDLVRSRGLRDVYKRQF
mgnify:CR=1 FL=1